MENMNIENQNQNIETTDNLVESTSPVKVVKRTTVTVSKELNKVEKQLVDLEIKIKSSNKDADQLMNKKAELETVIAHFENDLSTVSNDAIKCTLENLLKESRSELKELNKKLDSLVDVNAAKADIEDCKATIAALEDELISVASKADLDFFKAYLRMSNKEKTMIRKRDVKDVD
ncbi:hypothetical protein L7E35_004678 [Vibrio parahaemolyticus]|nr:hypothetical protein [Vibrio parahaemolyticus]EIV1599732.1 hypothetical protein [Vibrio parahaemolyticus]